MLKAGSNIYRHTNKTICFALSRWLHCLLTFVAMQLGCNESKLWCTFNIQQTALYCHFIVWYVALLASVYRHNFHCDKYRLWEMKLNIKFVRRIYLTCCVLGVVWPIFQTSKVFLENFSCLPFLRSTNSDWCAKVNII